MTTFRRLSLATTLTTLGVIGVGALVRATGSGDGCPAWPKCFGRWIPPMEHHAIIEWSHRAIGAVAITLLCATAVSAIVSMRHRRDILVPTLLATPAIFVQAILGAIVVSAKTKPTYASLEPRLVTLHIATAMALVAVLVHVTVKARIDGARAPVDAATKRWSMLAAIAVYGMILVGAFVRGQHAGLAFPDFPLMNGSLLPALGGIATTHFIHRALAVVVGVVLGIFVVRARRAGGTYGRFATAAGIFYLAQIVVGGTQVWTQLAWPPVVAHVVLASLIWSSLVAAITSAGSQRVPGRAAEEETHPQREVSRMFQNILAYVELTKPRIVVLLVITTVPTMILAARGMPSVWLMIATIGGGALAAGAANAINMYLDRDIDALMSRTKRRPIPAHRIEPLPALVFALVLAIASFVLMSLTVNVLAAILTQSAIVFYVFVYTLGLKRNTPQNIVIGGAAGAVPVLVGWAAVTGHVGIESYILFCVVFFWTPPHFWALAMRFSGDYAAAGVPMMPVVAGEHATRKQIFWYTVTTVAVTLALYPVADMGAVYLIAALALGGLFLRHAAHLLKGADPKAPMALFKYSILYLALLFAAVGVDAGIRGGA